MKQLVLVTVITLASTANALTAGDLMNKRDIALTAFGVADYYSYNCAGLTNRGKRIINDVYHKHGFNQMDTVKMKNTKEFRNGFEVAARYSCNGLRSALTDAGAGGMIRQVVIYDRATLNGIFSLFNGSYIYFGNDVRFIQNK